jgi:hypothetical protein
MRPIEKTDTERQTNEYTFIEKDKQIMIPKDKQTERQKNTYSDVVRIWRLAVQ